MTCPKPPFVGTISACEDLSAQVAAALKRLNPDHVHETWWTVEHVLTALINGGQIREQWGVRAHSSEVNSDWPDSDQWFEDRQSAEEMIEFRGNDGWIVRSTLVRRFVVTTVGVEVTL